MPATDITAATRYLISTSTTDLVQTLAACEGLGSSHFRLYKSMSFDKLHIFDIVVLRNTTDGAHNYLLQCDGCTLPASQATKITNQRMANLPRSAKLRKLNLFTIGPDDHMAAFTAQISRETCHLLWVCKIGITTTAPTKTASLRFAFSQTM